MALVLKPFPWKVGRTKVVRPALRTGELRVLDHVRRHLPFRQLDDAGRGDLDDPLVHLEAWDVDAHLEDLRALFGHVAARVVMADVRPVSSRLEDQVEVDFHARVSKNFLMGS